MAGLLDYLSSLKFEPDAKSMGLMNMGANMLNASSMSPTPIGFGNVMGAGLGGFNQGYMAQKKDDEALALAEQKKLLDAAAINKDNAMAGYYNTGGAGQNTDSLRQSTDGWFRLNKETKNPEFLTGPDGRRLMPQGSDLELIRAKHGMVPQQTVDANGNVDVVPTASLDPFYAQRTQNNISQPQPQANMSEEQIVEAYQNNQITKEQAIAALRSIAPPGMMPNEISLGVSRQPDLIQQASPSQARQTPAQGVAAKKLAETNATKSQDAIEAIKLLQQASPLVNNSTDSGIGNDINKMRSYMGFGSSEGADNAAALKVLSGNLVSKMPKMSGPQSDADVLLYQDMAGQIGNPTVPHSQKIKAMNEINRLQHYYAGIPEVPLNFNPKQSGWAIKEVK